MPPLRCWDAGKAMRTRSTSRPKEINLPKSPRFWQLNSDSLTQAIFRLLLCRFGLRSEGEGEVCLGEWAGLRRKLAHCEGES